MNKKVSRLRRAKKSRFIIAKGELPCLTIHRTNKHIYAQIFKLSEGKVLACASTNQKDVRQSFVDSQSNGGDVSAAKIIGKLIGERAVQLGLDRVAFDRAGFKYHGRIKALAESAREAGLKF